MLLDAMDTSLEFSRTQIRRLLTWPLEAEKAVSIFFSETLSSYQEPEKYGFKD